MNKAEVDQVIGLNAMFDSFERYAAERALARKQRLWDKWRDEDPNTLPDLSLIEAERRGESDPEE